MPSEDACDGIYLNPWEPVATLEDLREAALAEPNKVPGIGPATSVVAVQWSRNSRWLAAGTYGGVICVWDASNLKRLGSSPAKEDMLPDREPRTGLRSLAWSPDGKWLATGGRYESVDIWEPLSGKRHAKLVGRGLDLAWSPDGTQLVGASGDAEAIVWAVPSGKRVKALRPSRWKDKDNHFEGIVSVAWSPDGKRLATLMRKEGRVTLWDTATGQELLELEGIAVSSNESQSPKLAWSPDGRRLAIRHWSGMTMWDGSPR